MKQTVQPRAAQAQKDTAAPERSPRQLQTSAPAGYLAQLAAATNHSPRVNALAQLKDDIQHSPRIQKTQEMQGLLGLAAEINQGAPTQLRDVPANDDTGPDCEQIHDSPAPPVPASPVQRVRILLKDEDKVLMDRLRLVPVANVGAQTLQDPAQVGTLNEIAGNESIVLEGHGYMDAPIFGSPKVVSQGGIPPSQLAKLVHDVPKPAGWNGNVVLLGCSTGTITAAVSQEYFKLAGRTVNVIGTRANIRVGTKEDGTNFIGHDWRKQPLDQQPADLAFVEELLAANAQFMNAINQTLAVWRALDSNVKGVATPIPHPVDQVEKQGLNILDVESLSDHRQTALPDRRYAKPARIQMAAMFRNVFTEFFKVAFFKSPRTVNPIADVAVARGQLDNVLQPLQILSNQGMQLYTEVKYELHGYTLKEIDLASNVSAQHSKRRRTHEGIISDTWVDEP